MAESAGELITLLRSALLGRLEVAGWVVDEVDESLMGSDLLGAFRRPLSQEFSLAGQFWQEKGQDRRGTSVVITCEFGVSFDRSYRLWPVVEDDPRVWDAALEDKELTSRGQGVNVTVRSAGDVEAAAMDLAAVAARAVTVGGRYATVESLLGYVRSWEEDYAAEIVPLVLAAAGRSGEARSALDEYNARRGSDTGYRSFAFRLNSWMDSGDGLPDPPEPRPLGDRPEPGRVTFGPQFAEHHQMPSASEMLRQSRERRQKRDAATDAVRAVKTGKSRQELSDLLERELQQRGLRADPVSIDLGVDAIQADTPAERVRAGWRALRTIGEGLGGLVTELKNVGNPPPEWVRPPPKASYRASRTIGEWITVAADPGAAPMLERALSTAVYNPLPDDQVRFEVWLSWEPDPVDTRSLIWVHIAADKVATLDSNQTGRFRADMEGASRTGQLPAVEARITRQAGPPGYLLELGAPASLADP